MEGDTCKSKKGGNDYQLGVHPFAFCRKMAWDLIFVSEIENQWETNATPAKLWIMNKNIVQKASQKNEQGCSKRIKRR